MRPSGCLILREYRNLWMSALQVFLPAIAVDKMEACRAGAAGPLTYPAHHRYPMPSSPWRARAGTSALPSATGTRAQAPVTFASTRQ